MVAPKRTALSAFEHLDTESVVRKKLKVNEQLPGVAVDREAMQQVQKATAYDIHDQRDREDLVNHLFDHRTKRSQQGMLEGQNVPVCKDDWKDLVEDHTRSCSDEETAVANSLELNSDTADDNGIDIEPHRGEEPLGDDNSQVENEDVDVTPTSGDIQTGLTAIGTVAGPKATRESQNAMEVEFIIHAVDNNSPNPFGTHSITTGKLTYPAVKELYNTRFGKTVGTEAVAKRYRKNINRYRRDHPAYPTKILYAEEARVPRGTLRVEHKISRRGGHKKQVSLPQAAFDSKITDALSYLRQRGADDLGDPTVDANQTKRITKAKRPSGSYGPPDLYREAADLRNYVHSMRCVRDVDLPEYIHVGVQNDSGGLLGTVVIPTQGLKDNSLYYRGQSRSTAASKMYVYQAKKVTVERYAQCLSLPRRSKLPEYDYSLTLCKMFDGSSERRPKCERIEWDFEALSDLYLAARGFGDNGVCNLVLDAWANQLRQNTLHEPHQDAINTLFEELENDDPALRLWLLALNDSTASEEIRSSPTDWAAYLIEELERLAAYRAFDCPWQWSTEDFCHTFHHHFQLGKCSLSLEQGTIYIQPDYHAIAHRLLLAQGQFGKTKGTAAADENEIAFALQVQHRQLEKLY